MASLFIRRNNMYGIYDGSSVIAKFVAPMRVVNNKPIFSSDTLSLKKNIQTRPSQRWEIQTNLEPLSTTANDLFVFLTTRGSYIPFDIIMPQNYGVIKNRGINGNSPVLTSGAVFQAGSIQVSVSSINFIPKGTFIRFANHSKIYMTTNNRDRAGTLNVYPPLIADVPGSTEVMWKDDVLMPVYLDDTSVVGMVYTDGIVMDNGEIKLLEAL